MSKDNFKDEFERSRQEIKSHHHDEDETTEAINEKDDQPQASQNSNSRHRNASRRHRKEISVYQKLNLHKKIRRLTHKKQQLTKKQVRLVALKK
ncbi:hypothetical protein AAHB43_09400 [Staphylococcus pseudintermedius]